MAFVPSYSVADSVSPRLAAVKTANSRQDVNGERKSGNQCGQPWAFPVN